MDDQQHKLLDDHDVLILPSPIDHDALSPLIEASVIQAGKLVSVHYHGDDGNSTHAGRWSM